MTTVPDIIKDLGGSKAIADETGIPLTTVHSWKRAEFVPAWRIPVLVDLARRNGKRWQASDFPAERPNAAKVAA